MRVFFLVGILVFLVSCGKENDGNGDGGFNKNSGNPTTREIFTETDPEKRLSEVIGSYHVSCERPMECPGYMAMLVTERKDDLGFYNSRCSSFLVGDDVLATNAHCISDDLKEGDSCAGRIFALFPKSKDKVAQKIGCERILGKLRDDDLGFDYAFIKLSEKTDREIPEVDHGERLTGMDVTIWKVDPRESYFGLIRKNSCKLLDDSLYSYQSFFSPFSPSFGYAGCENLNGNSGSPLLNQQGKVIGINQSGIGNYSPKNEFFKDLIPDGHLDLLSYGTNFGCLCKKGDFYTNQCENSPANCRKKIYDDDLVEKFDQFMRDKAIKFLSEDDKNIAQSLIWKFNGYPVELGWKFSELYEYDRDQYDNYHPKSYKIFAGMFPKCLKNPKELVAQSSEQEVWGIKDLVFRIIGTTLCEIDVTFNSMFQVVGMKVNPEKCFAMDSRIQFNYTNRIDRTLEGQYIDAWWGFEHREGVEYPAGGDFRLDLCPENSLGTSTLE